jgi:hypothetical protein
MDEPRDVGRLAADEEAQAHGAQERPIASGVTHRGQAAPRDAKRRAEGSQPCRLVRGPVPTKAPHSERANHAAANRHVTEAITTSIPARRWVLTASRALDDHVALQAQRVDAHSAVVPAGHIEARGCRAQLGQKTAARISLGAFIPFSSDSHRKSPVT